MLQVAYDPTAPLTDVETSEVVPLDPLPLPAGVSTMPAAFLAAVVGILSLPPPVLPAPQEEVITAPSDDGDSKTSKATASAPAAAPAALPADGSIVLIDTLATSVDNYRLWVSTLQKVTHCRVLTPIWLCFDDVRGPCTITGHEYSPTFVPWGT